jgi:Mrp family chromosome partitioning ATPase/predicted Fe-Mo cluster-binding NifX family protein
MTKAATQNQQDQKQQMEEEQNQVRRRMSQIKHKILVLSGKGGVGKSTVAANMAVSLSLAGKRVGLLDIDIHGPSIPKILNLEDKQLMASGDAIMPISVSENLVVMSIGFMLQDRDNPVIWRGPMKYHMIKQFLKDVEWGRLDYLIIDSPPGTGDEPLSIIQLLETADGAVIVTTPQQVALSDVRKGVSFCRELNLPVLGVIENMSGFVCPKCGEVTDIFKSGGGENMALEMNIPFLSRIPMDPQIVHACDSGEPYIRQYRQSRAARSFNEVIKPILKLDKYIENVKSTSEKGDLTMRIAIPLVQGNLSLHFGHCDQFAIFEIDHDGKRIISRNDETPPAHEPGVLPKWLHGIGVNMIIAGGMGQRAQQLFTQNSIQVVVGVQGGTPEELISDYLQDKLQAGANICDH